MEIFKIDNEPELGKELPSAWAHAFSTTVDHFEKFTSLPQKSLAQSSLWEKTTFKVD
ncbi:hypothetical protein [Marinomonas mediterranea]|uniref:hypothetical protein n=1 Tax=Marinomonas mediterranea TaxID=119864 RepID=UPI00234A3F87|nr:hypothetical protein [Marinomonas mediterranea]WCN11270.1 hypothetical protein GV055_21215 [Marinomonas mediterranea]